jgi:hypothetical protein
MFVKTLKEVTTLPGSSPRYIQLSRTSCAITSTLWIGLPQGDFREEYPPSFHDHHLLCALRGYDRLAFLQAALSPEVALLRSLPGRKKQFDPRMDGPSSAP